MSISKRQELLLSQLVDHELPDDQANQVLADILDDLVDVLDDAEACHRLKAMLELRQVLSRWRNQEPPRAIVAVPSVERLARASHLRWRLINLATAAVLGGVLVAGGFYLGGRHENDRSVLAVADQPVSIVTPEQRRDIARAFALHESVAGPLSWYAADDTTIQVAPAQKGETLQKPIAVVLRLTQDGPNMTLTSRKTYVIVLRGNEPASIELPSAAAAVNLRVRLLSTDTNGRLNLQYAIASDGSGQTANNDAMVSGQRCVGLGPTALGQLALNDRLVNVDASAWEIQD